MVFDAGGDVWCLVSLPPPGYMLYEFELMVGNSNQADLNLISEIGITPDRSIRERRPTLKTVAQMVIFVARTKKLAGVWKEKRKIQESLVRKLEVVRSSRTTASRRSVAVNA